MRHLHIDFETCSPVKLQLTGADIYSRHPETFVHCAAWVIGDDPADIKMWFHGSRIPEAWLEPDIMVCAHNIEFERSIWLNTLKLPPPASWRCTMALAGAFNLPLSLDEASRALNLIATKDKDGYQLMRKLMTPDHRPARGELHRLAEYCVQDVVVELAIWSKLHGILTPTEEAVFDLDQRINERGIQVDTETAAAVLSMVTAEKDRLGEELLALTGGEVETGTQTARLVKWFRANGLPELANVKAETVTELLADRTIPAVCRRVLEIRSNWALGSIGKYAAMIHGSDENQIMRNLLQYCGAQQTGRWAGRRVQIHNLPRSSYKDGEITAAIEMYRAGDREGLMWAFGNVFEPAKRILRSMFHCPGGMLVSDFAQIEARVVAWLAGQDDLVAAFASGEPVYEKMAAKIFSVPIDKVTKSQRQVGKAAVLGCGFGMGAEKFAATAAKTGVVLEGNEAQRIVDTYRTTFPKIREFWYGSQNAFHEAIASPGADIPFGRGLEVREIRAGELRVRLPSGRYLFWHQIREEEGPYGPELSFRSATGNRVKTYGGMLVENFTQAVARDLLAAALLRLDSAGYEICAHVHDEVVIQNVTAVDVDKVSHIMSEIPTWAAGLPVAAETQYCPTKRYTK